ncbi:penicillin-binding protein [Patescibacteria group bacterium]|nr:penicillin-binding protein [Patescibacteria group bacterium]
MNKKQIKKDLSIFLIAIGIFGASFLMLWASTFKIPNIKNLEERINFQSSKIYDRTGEILLYDIYKDKKRTIVPYEDISRYVKNATVAIEDAEFYEHNGVKPTAFFRAIIANIKSGNFGQGGSTITQQVVKNTLLTTEKKISRKLKEWVLAIKLEKVMTKEEILTLYLNEVPYGGSIYGIEEASLVFFSKNSKNLTLAESAYLASIPKAPTFYSPYGENKNKLDERKDLVLEKMLENKFIEEEEYENAKKEVIVFKAKQETGIQAPHFVIFIKKYLEEKYGDEVLEKGGLKITTTLDYELQEKGEEIAKNYALENAEKFNAENIAFVAIDTKTGQILTMVGSRDYFDEKIDGNFNVATAHRQPGSAFKPFVYAAAFNKGFLPETVLFNLRTEFSTYCNPNGTPINPNDGNKCYRPENYDYKYTGPMTLRNALAQSVNVPSVKLLYLTGIQDSLKTAKDMGIESLTNINQYGLTLVLGGGEVSLLDITSAYGVFANEGIRNPYTGILKVEDETGKIIEEFKPQSNRVLPEQTALLISDVLSDNEARTPAFGAWSPLYFEGRDVASKTGTTNDYRDAWTIGYTTQVAVGAWAGNNDNSSMEKKVAGFIITPAWNTFMKEVLNKYPDEKFKKPEQTQTENVKPVLRGFWQGGETYFIDKISSKLATEYTPEETKEEKVIPGYHSILHWVDKNNILGPSPKNPENDVQYYRWEYAVEKWVKEQNLPTTVAIPTEYDDVHKPEFAPKITIIYPEKDKQYKSSEKINVMVSSVGKYQLTKLNYYLNGIFIGSSNTKVFSFVPDSVNDIKENNELKIIGFDSVLNKGETTTTLKLEI